MNNPYLILELRQLIDLLAEETHVFSRLSAITDSNEDINYSKEKLALLQAAIEAKKNTAGAVN